MRTGPVRRIGYSLIEVLIVVLVLGIVARVALPRLVSPGEGRVELAASEIAEALRFARAESMRTGEILAVRIDKDLERITVYRADLSTLPVTLFAESIVDHPLRRQPWDVPLASSRWTSGVDVANATGPFEYVGFAAQSTVFFNARGRPFGLDPGTGARYRLAASTAISLTHPGGARQIELHPIHGRVRVS